MRCHRGIRSKEPLVNSDSIHTTLKTGHFQDSEADAFEETAEGATSCARTAGGDGTGARSSRTACRDATSGRSMTNCHVGVIGVAARAGGCPAAQVLSVAPRPLPTNGVGRSGCPGPRVTRLRRLAGAGMTDACDVHSTDDRRVVVKLYRDGDGTAPLQWSRSSSPSGSRCRCLSRSLLIWSPSGSAGPAWSCRGCLGVRT